MRNNGWLITRFAAATVAVASLIFFSSAAVWADTKPVDQIRQVGATTIVYRGPQANIAVSYQYPKRNPEGRWLMLDTAMVAARAPIEVRRAAISLRTPSGDIVPLASPTEYTQAYPQLAWFITRDNATREPLGLLTPQPYVPLQFFPVRGLGLAFDSQWLDSFHNSYGRLFFKLPGTLTRGTYELQITLSEGQVVIPFTI